MLLCIGCDAQLACASRLSHFTLLGNDPTLRGLHPCISHRYLTVPFRGARRTGTVTSGLPRGARSQGEVHGFYVAQLRRRMGVTAVREFARHRLRRAAYVGVPRAVVEQMMQQEAMRVRLHGQPAAEPPYADFFAWAGQQPAAARDGGGG